MSLKVTFLQAIEKFGTLLLQNNFLNIYCYQTSLLVFFKWPNPGHILWFIFSLFKQTTLQFLPQIYVKNVHLDCSAGIRINNLWNTSLLPLPLDQSSRSSIHICYTQTCFVKLAFWALKCL